jgi:hypothetical protein
MLAALGKRLYTCFEAASPQLLLLFETNSLDSATVDFCHWFY